MRLIDADRIVYSWLIDADGEGHDGITLQSIIKKVPTVDAVEVVRCKDCIHCADDYVDTGFGAMPTFTWDIFEGYGVGIKPDHYCSYGERGDSE